MSTSEKLHFKHRLKAYAINLISQRIATARAAMAHAQQAANSEEKSSAGDKYETGRAMGHLEKDMHARQLASAMAELATLSAIDVQTLYNTVAAGAVIHTRTAIFFMAAGLGRQRVNGQDVFFLSPSAPLAVLLLQKEAGAHFPFNGTTATILDVY
ncbi:hypothetical protein DCM91_00265 [Chitinophaga costaii]|nr:hypothetical protein [Chitinophaga costaii]PUZ29953.1 hypothetical protein DCM91_00265 [Chitinophaga costaii]